MLYILVPKYYHVSAVLKQCTSDVFSFPCRGFDKPTYIGLNEKQKKKKTTKKPPNLYLCNAKDDLVWLVSSKLLRNHFLGLAD